MAIFRKKALERLSSPEQLDQLIQVTNPQGWLALSALVVLLLGALTWGVFGSVPTSAAGEGILLRSGGVSDLVSIGSGQVEDILVAVGDVVEKGQTVARVRQDATLRQIDDVEARRAALAEELESLEIYAREQLRLSARNQEQKRANYELSIRTLQREVEILEEQIAAQRELLADGLITQQTLLATEQQLNASRDRLAAQRLELGALELERLEAEQRLQEQLEERRSRMRDLDLQLRELRGSLEENANVVSPRRGRVLELMADRGDVLQAGTSILSMEIVSEDLLAVLFVPAALGKQVRPGMEARISPSNVQREEHGYMLGEVTWVADFPSTRRGMQRLLVNEELVDRLLGEGPPIQIDVRLQKDPSLPSGYRWSSSKGPPNEISSGTLASGNVIVESKRPISLVIPGIRQAFGL